MCLSIKKGYRKCWKKWIQACNRENYDRSKRELEGRYVFLHSVHFVISLLELSFYKTLSYFLLRGKVFDRYPELNTAC